MFQSLVGKRERVDFANTVIKYDRRFKADRYRPHTLDRSFTLPGRLLSSSLIKHFKERTRGGILQLEFATSHTIVLKKTRFGGGTRTVQFHLSGSSALNAN
ncbi:hypothetical protein COOONC_19417 [Cooperia oncophora]